MNEQEGFSSPEKGEKQRRWDEVAERVGRTVDRLEKHIDEGIKEGVIALNALDVNTHSSCEGHLDRGVAAPWIDIQAKFSKEEEEQFRELFKTKEENKEKFKESRDDIERRNLEEQRKIIPHLADFYKDRDVPFERRLMLGSATLGRLESQGARFQKIENDETKQVRLKEYQEEMNAFIAFLKERYFAEISELQG
jgi:hypothetical protein